MADYMFNAMSLRKHIATTRPISQKNNVDMDDYDDFDDYEDDDYEDDLDFEIEHEDDDDIIVTHDIQYNSPLVNPREIDHGYSVEVYLNGDYEFVDDGFDSFKAAYRAGQKYLRQHQ